MAELHAILGSIFRDIAQARVTSDLFSRNISKYYEQDPLLRRFPTPRTEVEEVEVDLKFVILGLEQTETQDESREASTATVFIKLAEDISEHFFSTVLELVREYPDFLAATTKRLEGFEHRIYLKQNLLLYFQRQRALLIREGKFDERKAFDDITQILVSALTQLLRSESGNQSDDLGPAKSQQDELKDKIFRKLEVKSQLKSQRKRIEEAYTSHGDPEVAVEVTVDKLAETPDAAICSVKVKAHVRNYTWSKVEHEGKTWRALNPE